MKIALENFTMMKIAAIARAMGNVAINHKFMLFTVNYSGNNALVPRALSNIKITKMIFAEINQQKKSGKSAKLELENKIQSIFCSAVLLVLCSFHCVASLSYPSIVDNFN